MGNQKTTVNYRRAESKQKNTEQKKNKQSNWDKIR